MGCINTVYRPAAMVLYRHAIVWGLLGVYALLTHSYARLWVHPLPLWTHAARIAPLKPRPWLHVGIGSIMVGRLDAAEVAFNRAAEVAKLSHVLPWDRDAALKISAQNRHALMSLRRRLVG